VDYDTSYYAASGRHRNYSFLAQRYRAGEAFRPGSGECWIGWVEPDPVAELRFTFRWMTDGWYTGLWRSADDRVWVSVSQGEVLEFARPGDDDYRSHPVDGLLFGIYGVSDAEVYAWGERRSRPAVFRWDGAAWSALAPPPFEVECMHALTAGAPWIAGSGGRVARWDGAGWRGVDTDSDERLLSIFVAGADELYACGDRGSILAGTARRLARIGSIPVAGPAEVQAIAKWRGDLWVAASRLGLWRGPAGTAVLTCYKPKLDAVSLDVRDGIVVACQYKVSSSDDGAAFRSTAIEHLLNDRADKRLGEP